MKRVVGGAVLLVAILAFGLAPVFGEEQKTADAVKALDAKLTDAFKNRDVKTLEKFTAADFIAISPTGKVHDRKEFFERMGKSTLKVADLKETDVKVRVLGDTAVVTGLLEIKASTDTKDISGDYRWTRVYAKKGADWMVLSEQHTFVLPATPPK
jgi:ketosteroid isomerase-like protein